MHQVLCDIEQEFFGENGWQMEQRIVLEFS
jgi:hypothetical protein